MTQYILLILLHVIVVCSFSLPPVLYYMNKSQFIIPSAGNEHFDYFYYGAIAISVIMSVLLHTFWYVYGSIYIRDIPGAGIARL